MGTRGVWECGDMTLFEDGKTVRVPLAKSATTTTLHCVCVCVCVCMCTHVCTGFSGLSPAH